MIIYISGPITGTDDYEERFAEAARVLIEKGHTVVNPAGMVNVIAGNNIKHDDYLKFDLKLLEAADAICLLPGWKNSKGASAEYQRAARLNKQICYAQEVPEI